VFGFGHPWACGVRLTIVWAAMWYAHLPQRLGLQTTRLAGLLVQV
jgi:hypothetical protein